MNVRKLHRRQALASCTSTHTQRLAFGFMQTSGKPFPGRSLGRGASQLLIKNANRCTVVCSRSTEQKLKGGLCTYTTVRIPFRESIILLTFCPALSNRRLCNGLKPHTRVLLKTARCLLKTARCLLRLVPYSPVDMD
jgi:hypothetical protein